MLRISPAELSVYAPVGCRDPVCNSAANGIEVGHVGKFVQTRRDGRQLDANTIHSADRRILTRQLSCVSVADVCIGLNVFFIPHSVVR